MEQRLITIAIDYNAEDEQDIANALAAVYGGSASTIKDAVTVMAEALRDIPKAHVPHWSSPQTEKWMNQEETISNLWRQIDNHFCQCCHQVAVAPVGATDFEPGTCPPLHNCALCADQII